MADHGRLIFIYNNIRTNQVIYSLSLAIKESRALRQLTFVGKKSVPSEIRPDLWRPLATVFFPTGHRGLCAYRKLREFRKMHEFCWESEPGRPLPPKKERMKMLMDQKANSIADLAAVLKIQEQEGALLEQLREKNRQRDLEAIAKKQERKRQLAELAGNGKLEELELQLKKLEARHDRVVKEDRKKAIRDQIRAHRRKIIAVRTARKEITGQKGSPSKPADVALEQETDSMATQTEVGKDTGLVAAVEVSREKQAGPTEAIGSVVIRWADLTDAEYAESWPSGVFHDVMGVPPTLGDAEQGSSSAVDGHNVLPARSNPRMSDAEKTNAGFMGRIRSIFSRETPRVLDRAST